MKQKNKKKYPVDESVQVAKAREKLKKRLESVEKRVTEQALEKKSVEIHKWISKNASERVVLYDKNISLFDENQNTAKVSQRVGALAEKIKNEMNLLRDLAGVEEEIILE
jgi:hypothetical protein